MDEHDTGTPDAADETTVPVEAPRRGLWQRIAGDGTHIGFWTLPVFIATALAGAVIAGAIAQVYYGQQVAALEDETRAARTAAEVAAEEIDAARQEALAAIEEQVAQVRDALEVARPLDDPAQQGVVALEVALTPAPAPSPSPAAPAPSSTTGTDGEVQGAPLPAPADAQPTSAATTRAAVGFVVAAADGETFVATTYDAVVDPRGPDGVATGVTVVGPTGRVAGVVHAWDEPRGVAVVRVPDLGVAPLPWRPADTPLVAGDVVVLAAVTPAAVGVQLPGRVGARTDTALVTDLPYDPVFDGAPLVDAQGRVVGVQASTARPFGPGSSGAIVARELCVELIAGCDLLEQATDDEATPPAEG